MVWHNQCRNAVFQQRVKSAPPKESPNSRSVGFVYLHLYEHSFVCGRPKFGFGFSELFVLLSLLHFMLIKSNSSGLARYSLSAKKLKQQLSNL